MNLEQFPKEIKEDIEDQSLEILGFIRDKIIVVGGWGVRAHLGEDHNRFTLDVDGVANEEDLRSMKDILMKLDMKPNDTEWGIQFFKKYVPKVDVPEDVRDEVETVELRIEISEPRITEFDSPHYFEFSLTEFDCRELPFHKTDGSLSIKVPPVEHLAAVKLGLPVDYKNNIDSAGILRISDIDLTIEIIIRNDDWKEMVLRRLPKSIGRIGNKDRIENMIALNAGINIKEHIKKLKYIEEKLRS